MYVSNYGTIFVTIADHDKEQALPQVRSGSTTWASTSDEATTGTAEFLRAHGIRTRTRRKQAQRGQQRDHQSAAPGHVLRINTIDINQHNTPRRLRNPPHGRQENNVTVFTALRNGEGAADVLEEITLRVSTIDSK